MVYLQCPLFGEFKSLRKMSITKKLVWLKKLNTRFDNDISKKKKS